MSEIKEVLGAVTDSAAEVAKKVYDDVAHPTVKPAGEIVGLVPRAIKAALAPLEKWIMQKEYNLAETKKLLEEKLKNVSADKIETPEPYVAVPALQYLSYCMDNAELRDMYANLLANSMSKVVKNGVHPGYVEIIKQLSPDEAKLMRYFFEKSIVPTINLRYENERREGIDVVRDFSNIGTIVGCENPMDISKYFDNLVRLGLIMRSAVLSRLTEDRHYEPLKMHPYIVQKMCEAVEQKEYNLAKTTEGFMSITDYGKSFCVICLTPPNGTE